MVAVLLLLICVTPAMRIYTNMYMAQQTIIRENQRDHLAYRIHAYIIEQLYKRIIPFSELLIVQENSLNDSALQDELKKWNYEAFYAFIDPKKKKSSNKSEKADKRFVTLVISIKDLKEKKTTSKTPERPTRTKTSTTFLQEQENDPAYTQYKFKIYLFTPEGENIKDAPVDEEAIPIEEKEDEDELEEDEEENPFGNDQDKKDKNKETKENKDNKSKVTQAKP
ncbi:MAG: hypothetical protein Q8K60_09175 [Parachlamydiaceae bacterium]|nr:hypothetical protein [Parachlamydiaceae bacterium]